MISPLQKRHRVDYSQTFLNLFRDNKDSVFIRIVSSEMKIGFSIMDLSLSRTFSIVKQWYKKVHPPSLISSRLRQNAGIRKDGWKNRSYRFLGYGEYHADLLKQ